MFDQCFANVWPKARQSPQTVSNGAVCFAKCKHDTLNALILSDLLAFQRGRILRKCILPFLFLYIPLKIIFSGIFFFFVTFIGKVKLFYFSENIKSNERNIS